MTGWWWQAYILEKTRFDSEKEQQSKTRNTEHRPKEQRLRALLKILTLHFHYQQRQKLKRLQVVTKNMESWSLFLTVTVCHHLVTVLRQRRRKGAANVFAGVQYLPFSSDVPAGTLVIDVTHMNALSMTLEDGEQVTFCSPEERPETTTAACLSAIMSERPPSWTKSVKFVTSLHFDVDNFVAVWSVLNPNLAIVHQRILREVARVGDFRECRLDSQWQQEVLKLICWLHSEERRLFLKSYESKSNTSEKTDMGVKKFQHFLQLFASVLCDPEPFKEQWCAEYDRVTKEYIAVAALSPIVYSNLGCVIVKLPDPAHYYALFSTSTGYDIVFSMYRGNRYEVEMKYTSMVSFGRPVLPRLDMTPLVNNPSSFHPSPSSQQTPIESL